ncbi:virulence-associated E family protein [Neobacillus sp. YX16]|uniref:virulence-associated E family protein n=1 Tax=Neobacillus sp. YX16 TaxID=3047874 RepID=UPI0024C4009D|nr:virulence-associated E family protein [Neobacillus sp. YX16]WHZ04961.1 virulence-associated E family protein [Neobacillus sp. YX16]
MELSHKQLAKIATRREQQQQESKDEGVKDWLNQLEKSNLGTNLSTPFNVLSILQHDQLLKGKFAYNLLTQMSEIVGQVPWERLTEDKGMTDYDDSCLRNYISIQYGIKGKDIIYDAFNQVILNKKYHPVRDYLNNLKWDGIPRLDKLLIDYFGADDTELIRSQTRLTGVGAVMRIFQPGCKWDYVLTLKGDQGLGKSSFFQKLAVKSEWFSDSIDDMRGKEAKAQIQGNWIIELGEMAAVSKGDQKRTKQFISSTHDEFRPAYGRRTIRCPRQCIFVATTNDELPLKDDTGGRRWWIIDVKSKWFEKDFPLEVEQIWAEAVQVYKEMISKGIPFKLPNHLENEARKIQTQYTDMGLYAGIIEDVLQRGYYEEKDYQSGMVKKVPINETCARHVWEKVVGRHKHDFNSAHARDINAGLKSLADWECKGRLTFGEYGKQTVYRRKDR